MKTFNICHAPGTIIQGRELPLGCIYGTYQGTTYYCESLFSPKKGYLYIRRYNPKKKVWMSEDPIRNALTEYILSVCKKHGIEALNIKPVPPSYSTVCHMMKHDRGFKKQGSCMKTATKLHYTRGDSNDFDRYGNYGYGKYKNTTPLIFK